MIAIILAPIYLLVNFYILRWNLRWMKACSKHFKKKWFKILYIILYTFISTSLVVAFLLPTSSFQRLLKQISNYWLGTFLYIILLVALFDLIRIIVLHTKAKNTRIVVSKKTFVTVGGICILFIILISTYGILHAKHIYNTDYDIYIDKTCGTEKSMKVVMVADLHLGYSIGTRDMEKMVKKINKLNADLVCIAGDIFDNDYDALDNPEKLEETLKGIKSKYGVYACYGNHDIEEKILAGFTFKTKDKKEIDPRMDEFLEKANIKLLSDDIECINNEFYLIGRIDYSTAQKSKGRKNPEELTEGLDKSKPIFVIDHQPRELQELSDCGVDLDMCGHTHDGQLFPGNILTKVVWENGCGYLKKGDMHSVVTSGLGVWGPDMRVGTKSEITEINIKFR